MELHIGFCGTDVNYVQLFTKNVIVFLVTSVSISECFSTSECFFTSKC